MKRHMTIIAVLTLLVVVMGHVMATQWFAKQLMYDAQFLGNPLLTDSTGARLYLPWKVHQWSAMYEGGQIDPLIKQCRSICLASVPVGLIGSGALVYRLNQPEQVGAHGSARWATHEEIQQRGLLKTPAERELEILNQANQKGFFLRLRSPKGRPKCIFDASCVVLGQNHDGRYLYDSSDEHVLAIAPTRTGKGVGLIIPTLLSWTGSVFVLDFKGENYRKTSHYRREFSYVIYFNPSSEEEASARLNPLAEVRRGVNSIKDTNQIAQILGDDDSNPFWTVGAKELLQTTMLYVIYACQEKTLSQTLELLFDGEATLEMMLATDFEDDYIRRAIHGVAKKVLGAESKVRKGWISGAQNALALWKDPLVQQVTSVSDFAMSDFQFADRPLSFYLCIPPTEIDVYNPLIRLLFSQLVSVLTRQEVIGARKLLMMCDEFPMLGKMSLLEKSMSLTASYGIRWFIIAQGMTQLDAIYGRHHMFLLNCGIRITYRCNDDESAKRLSLMLGTATWKKQQESQNRKPGLFASLLSRSKTEVEFPRELLKPSELMTLDNDRSIIMHAGREPILGYKLRYYNEPHFVRRQVMVDLPTEPLDDFPNRPKVLNAHQVKTPPKRYTLHSEQAISGHGQTHDDAPEIDAPVYEDDGFYFESQFDADDQFSTVNVDVDELNRLLSEDRRDT